MFEVFRWTTSVVLQPFFFLLDCGYRIFGEFTFVATPLILIAIAVVLAIRLPANWSVPLGGALVFPILWILLPITISVSPFQSALLMKLEQSRAKNRDADGRRRYADPSDVAQIFPRGRAVAEAEELLRSEGFTCGKFRDWSPGEAAELGEKYRHFKVCDRWTRYHPLGHFGWKIELFADQNGTIQHVTARHYYDGI